MERAHGDEIVIALSGTKNAMLLAGSLAFVAVGIALWFIAEAIDDTLPVLFTRAVGLIAVGFFGLCAVYIARKLADASPGLVLDGRGIHDNSSGLSAGTVPWDDVTGLRETIVAGQRFLAIDVADPDKYITRGSALQRQLKAMNARLYGSPIFISAGSLKTTHAELMALTATALARHRSRAPSP